MTEGVANHNKTWGTVEK